MEYTFYKEKDQWHDNHYQWYVDLPDYPGSKAELEMVEGADTMLQLLLDLYGKEGDTRITLQISLEEFEGHNELLLLRKDEIIGGGHYLLKKYDQYEFNLELWLCSVTEWVFGYLPEKIYIKVVEK